MITSHRDIQYIDLIKFLTRFITDSYSFWFIFPLPSSRLNKKRWEKWMRQQQRLLQNKWKEKKKKTVWKNYDNTTGNVTFAFIPVEMLIPHLMPAGIQKFIELNRWNIIVKEEKTTTTSSVATSSKNENFCFHKSPHG